MNKKLIFGLIVICIAIASISTVSAWWIFGGDDLVDVIDVVYETTSNNFDTPFGGAIDSAAAQYADEQQQKIFEESGKVLTEQEYQELQDKYIQEHGGDTTDNNKGSYLSAFAFKIIPKETISQVNSFKLNNLKITYENGVTDDIGSVTFNNKNTYLENNEYGFHYNYYINEDVRGQKVHINADIVIDTLSEQDKVIGHLDYDVIADGWSATYA